MKIVVTVTRSRSPEHLAVDDESRTEEDRIAALFIDHNLDSWEIADYNKDGTLTREEFLNFQHPEQNRNTVVHSLEVIIIVLIMSFASS